MPVDVAAVDARSYTRVNKRHGEDECQTQLWVNLPPISPTSLYLVYFGASQ